MRPVLLIRPLPCSDALQNHLTQAGVQVVHLPTLALNAHNDAQQDAHIQTQWANYTGMIFVSQHAAQFAHAHLTRLKLTLRPQTWLGAVGQGTLATLKDLWPQHQAFITPSHTDSQDSEGLWRAISAHHQTPRSPQAQRLLIIRAQTGRDLLRQNAENARMTCDVWACYQRQAHQWTPEECTQFHAIQTQQPLIVATSSEGLDALCSQPTVTQRPNGTLVAIHPRIVQHAQQLGFEDVHLCPPAQLAEQLQQWAGNSPIQRPHTTINPAQTHAAIHTMDYNRPH